jgi:hypothetical protein
VARVERRRGNVTCANGIDGMRGEFVNFGYGLIMHRRGIRTGAVIIDGVIPGEVGFAGEVRSYW